MNPSAKQTLAKVPEISLGFWLMKVAATTLGETGGDAVSMSMDLGYLVGTAIFAALFAVAVCVQIRASTYLNRINHLPEARLISCFLRLFPATKSNFANTTSPGEGAAHGQQPAPSWRSGPASTRATTTARPRQR